MCGQNEKFLIQLQYETEIVDLQTAVSPVPVLHIVVNCRVDTASA